MPALAGRGSHAPFWAIPAELFAAEQRGAAMGMISLIGNIGAFIGPYAVGYVRQETGSFVVGAIILVGSLWIGALLATQLKDRKSPSIERIYGMEAP
jgi:nitrate/nitrite transporter NarK